MMLRNLFSLRLSWAAWCLAAITGLLAARPAPAQAPAMVRIRPETLTLAPDETAVLAIAVDQGVGVFGVEINLLFDPAVLQIVDADQDQAGVQVQDGLYLDTSQGLVVANEVDNEAGVLAYGMTLLAPAEPVSGSGTLLNVTVRAVAPGDSPLILSVILASNDGLALPVEALQGSVTVAEGQSPPGTPALPTPPPATSIPDASQGAGESPVTGSAADGELAPLPGEPGSSAPEAPVQTAAARQETREGGVTSPGLRPTGPAPVATGVLAGAGGPAGDSGITTGETSVPAPESVGGAPEGADQVPPLSDTTGSSAEGAAPANPPLVEGGSGPASEISGPGSDGEPPTMGAIGALVLALALGGIATFYLLRKFLSRER